MWLKLSFTAFMAVLVPVYRVNHVFGMNDAQAHSWLPQPLYLCGWIVTTLFTLTYLPAHLVLRRLPQPQGTRNGS